MTRFDIIEKYASEYLVEKVAAQKGKAKKSTGGAGGALAGALAGMPVGAMVAGPVIGIPTGAVAGGILGHKYPGLGAGALLGGLASIPAGAMYYKLRHINKPIKEVLKDAFRLKQRGLVYGGLGLAGAGLGGYLGARYWGNQNK